ncbi:ARM repeat-containing protein [Rickenella mellea]|uniref:ARM repeat-containing protein n=1 Tax=Rickenella mellea TaxID=50990 RepID=A0A4Y7QHN8_9AGAM|nr:ARM repeat-containing protein [Rickenella mellea]
MGKSQKKRTTRRHNPVRVPDSHLPKGLDAAANTSSKRDAVLPIIQKLEGPAAEDRAWACSAVSNLIQNDPSTRRLLQGKNIVGALINRLTDSVEEVVVEATGALRNLCIDGGYEICAEMYNKNILTPLKTFLPKISTALQAYLTSPKSAPESVHELVFGFAENVITIIWCLSETSNKALNAINQIRLVPFLMSFVENRENLSLKTVVSAAQCLYVLSDDNDPIIEDVRSHPAYTSCLLSVVQQEAPLVSNTPDKDAVDDRQLTLRVLVAGILRNVSPIPMPSAASGVDVDQAVVMPLLLPVISSTSLSDTAEKVSLLVTIEENPTIENLSLKHTPKSDHKSAAERELERIEGSLRTIQLALEILTGVCATLPDPEPEPDAENIEDIEEEDKDDDSDVHDTAMDTDESTAPMNGDISTDPPASKPTFLPSIVEPLLALIQPTPLSFPPLSATPSVHPPTTSALSAIHVSAFECLNNILLSLAASPPPSVSTDIAGGKALWDAVWRSLGIVGMQGGRGQERRKEIWDVAVGVLWGVGKIWMGHIVPDGEQVQVLMQFCDASDDDQVKVKCIGTLECLAQNPTFIDANKVISTYLIAMLPSPGNAATLTSEPILQVVSAIIDIYSDEIMPYDVNFRQLGFLDTLSNSIDGVKKTVKGIDRRQKGSKELRRRGEELLENLVAFVTYRRNLVLQP